MKFMSNLSKKKKIILAVVLVIIISAGGFYYYIRSNVFVPNVAADTTDSSQEVDYQVQKGITNILLIGTDGRTLDEQSRSDSIIIATIDNNTKKVKLTSVVRDTYVEIKGHGNNKINAAFAFGGADLLMDTIQRNFNIKLDKYVIINFWGFEGLVDSIGGLDIAVKDTEVAEVNKFIGETDTVKSPALTQGGLQHLDGQQSLAYARIRHVGNGVYERDSRQRTVITLLVDKLKDTSLIQYPKVLAKLLPCFKTNIEPTTIINYAYTVANFKPITIDQLEMPIAQLSDGRIYNSSWVLLMDKTQNGKMLNNFIFNDKKPVESDFNLNQFKSVINTYLAAEKKSNPTVNQSDPALKKEPYASDHTIR